jgi:predicted nucleotidyltransferase
MSNDIAQVIQQTAAVLKASGAKEVYIFGSAAKGTMKEGSDVDFAVAGLPQRNSSKH